ncbi:hypothetical protein [Sphingomonas melonis]|uniref:hypothetical protein n=1 Tax=Sphingomonas melonis TaxID=152682 RepID=UPI0035C85CCF
MTSHVDPETRRVMLQAIFEVAIAAQDDATGVALDTAAWIARAEVVDGLVAATEQALQAVLHARAAAMDVEAPRVNLATIQPAGRA